MFGFTLKKRKRNANKRKVKHDNKRSSVRIEELDTPDTPDTPAEPASKDGASELTPYEPIVLNKNNRHNNANKHKHSPTVLMTRSNKRVSHNKSKSRYSQRSKSRHNNHHRQHHRIRTPTPYPHQAASSAIPDKSHSHSISRGIQKPLNIEMEGDMILFFIEMLTTVKLYHWKTQSFATHKATDELYDDLNKYVDEFVEVMLGYKGGNRVNLPRTSVKLNDFMTAEQFKRKLNEYKSTLISYTRILDPEQNSDLLNIRDELLATLNRAEYLLSFR